MALKGLRVLEMAGLAPAPFCGLLLADLGAGVIRVDRPKSTTFYSDRFTRGKQAIAIDLSQKDGQGIFLKLCENSDILIGNADRALLQGEPHRLNCNPTEGRSFYFFSYRFLPSWSHGKFKNWT
jgi:crotonobetainyl-CoA:carnitine CoA-transferase CaiB-like acyl-CoA transferase